MRSFYTLQFGVKQLAALNAILERFSEREWERMGRTPESKRDADLLRLLVSGDATLQQIDSVIGAANGTALYPPQAECRTVESCVPLGSFAVVLSRDDVATIVEALEALADSRWANAVDNGSNAPQADDDVRPI